MINRFRIAFAIIRHSFNFLSRRRERREAAVHAEREHQLAMLRLITSALQSQAESTERQVSALADAVRSQNEVLQQWLKGFQTPSTVPAEPTAPIVPDADELLEAHAFAMAMGADAADFPVELPPEFGLAFALDKLNKKENEDFDREGSDLI